MHIQIEPVFENQLTHLAAALGQTPEYVVNDALGHYFSDIKLTRLRAAIAEGDAGVASAVPYDTAFMPSIIASAKARVARGDTITNKDATGE